MHWYVIIHKHTILCLATYALFSDVKECLIGTHNCSQLCEELDGGYECSCYDGYELEDSFTCKGIKIKAHVE